MSVSASLPPSHNSFSGHKETREERINYMLLKRFMTQKPVLAKLTFMHSGLVVNQMPPYPEGFFMSEVYHRLLKLQPTRHGAAIPVKAAWVYTLDRKRYRTYLSSTAMLLIRGRVYAVYKRQFARVYFNRDWIEVDPEDIAEPRYERRPLRGVFFEPAMEHAKYTGKLSRSIRLAARSFVLSEMRGPLKQGLSEVLTVQNPIVYVLHLFEEAVDFIPDALGFKRFTAIVSADIDIIEEESDKKYYTMLARIRGSDNYVLLRHLPAAAFRREDIIFGVRKMLRTEPPYFSKKRTVECLLPGSIVRRPPIVQVFGQSRQRRGGKT